MQTHGRRRDHLIEEKTELEKSRSAGSDVHELIAFDSFARPRRCMPRRNTGS
jgi:hypothetical protein